MTNPRDPVKVPEEAARDLARAHYLLPRPGYGESSLVEAMTALLTTRESALRAEIERLDAELRKRLTTRYLTTADLEAERDALKAENERIRSVYNRSQSVTVWERAERAEAQLAASQERVKRLEEALEQVEQRNARQAVIIGDCSYCTLVAIGTDDDDLAELDRRATEHRKKLAADIAALAAGAEEVKP